MTTMINSKMLPKGECDNCAKTNVELHRALRLMLCLDCFNIEQEAVKQSKHVESIIRDARKQDAEITSKDQIFIADTVPAIELMGAIQADENIPADQKDYAFIKECETRYLGLKSAMFTARQELAKMEAEARIWQSNIQTTAGKLHGELRKKYEQFDIEYKPTKVVKDKTFKPQVVKTPKRKTFTKADMAELSAVAKKYGIGEHVFTVQSLVINRNMSYDDAARTLAIKLGILTETV